MRVDYENLRATKEELFIVNGFFVPSAEEDGFGAIDQTLLLLQSVYGVWPKLGE
jgi:hypothetical protein